MIGYGTVSTEQTGDVGSNNGKAEKDFNISTPSSAYSGVAAPPYFFPNEPFTDITGNVNYIVWLDPTHKRIAPTASSALQGKITSERRYDASGNLVHEIRNHYRLLNYSNNFYSVQSFENRIGGFTQSCPTGYSLSSGLNSGGGRPVNLLIKPAKAYKILLDTVTKVAFQGLDSLVEKEVMNYDLKGQLKAVNYISSTNDVLSTSFTYPYEYQSGGFDGNTTLVYEMMGRNMNKTIISKASRKNGVLIDSLFTNYFSPASGIIVPSMIKIQIGLHPMEPRQTFTSFDLFGHITQMQKPDNTPDVFLWGYANHFPVAKIVGASFQQVNAIVDQSILNNPPSDLALRDELNKIRLQLPGVLVVIYTYDPVFGITSQTDINGKTAYYFYRSDGKLDYIQDQDHKVLKRYCYNYAGQPEDCVPVVTYTNAAVSQSFTRNNCTGCTAGSAVVYSVAAGTYASTVSQAAADQLAQNDINTNGQAYANANGQCTSFSGSTITYQNTAALSGYIALYTHNTTGATYNFTIPASGSGILGCIPEGKYTLTISKRPQGIAPLLLFGTGCQYQSGNWSAVFNNVNIGATRCNNVSIEWDLY